jgi:hypothetical protein
MLFYDKREIGRMSCVSRYEEPGAIKRIAVKFCGGCDAQYDRVDYVLKIRREGRGKITWVTLDDPPFDAILLINGCTKACKEKDLAEITMTDIVSVRDNTVDPHRIIDTLLNDSGAT